MSPAGDKAADQDDQAVSNLGAGGSSTRDVPLVIVSERGRHSSEARRIVRAQAARASAAQSRVTRAKNREEREGFSKEGPQTPLSEQPPEAESAPPPLSSSSGETSGATTQVLEHPLIKWIISLLDLTPSGLLNSVQNLTMIAPAAVGAVTSTLIGGVGGLLGTVAGVAGLPTDIARPQLPQAVPRGFTMLQQRIQISDHLITLVSRTSCFDFGSPGVEERLHQLLFDLIISHAKALLTPILVPGHAIQGHLRIACTCLTIFQGQRADSAVLAHDQKYRTGLDAAWSEVMLLDQNALTEPKSAEASLWAVFIISVTTNSTATFFHQLLYALFQDLQLQSWLQVRNVLLDFIYPVSFLDEPCQTYFNTLQQQSQVAVA
jgi:hypothetical protein